MHFDRGVFVKIFSLSLYGEKRGVLLTIFQKNLLTLRRNKWRFDGGIPKKLQKNKAVINTAQKNAYESI